MNRIKKTLAIIAATAVMALGTVASAAAAGVASPVKPPVPVQPAKPTITVGTTAVTSSTTQKTFDLGVKVSNGAKVTYASNNSKVKVDANGKVTVAKNFVGTAKITIKAGDTTKTVTVTVRPARKYFKSAKSNKKGQLTAKFNNTKKVSGVQVQYARNSKFTSAKTKTYKSNTTTSATISNLKSGKTYYVRVRFYKVVNGKRVYSQWTRVRSTKIK